MKTTGIQLQEKIDQGLSRSCGRHLSQKPTNEFINRVLAEFDYRHQYLIENEIKQLSGGETAISDTTLPPGFQRTVIREALSDLRILDLVQTLTDFRSGVTTQIPYETRDISQLMNGGIVYEGNPIPRASVIQDTEIAYILPMKMAFLITNEIMYFSKSSPIDWDAYARNAQSNARIIREQIAMRVCNELQRAADAFQAQDITDETFDTQLDGSTSIIKSAKFPIVRPFQEYDIKGTIIGAPENPIVVMLNGTALSSFNGSGDQTPGIYYRVINYNMGYLQFVDEAGSPVTPTDSGTNTLSYSYATNVVKVDTDLGALKLEERMNDIILAVGSQRAMMSTDRYIQPDFLLMSPVLNDMATNAKMFTSSGKRSGTDVTADGDLETIKGIPAWGTNAPGIDLGDERIIMGQKDTVTYTVTKSFTTGEPFEATNAEGQPIGKKQAYGEEYSAIKVPKPTRNRLTSVLAYSFSGR